MTDSDRPLISIIIPTRNMAESLEKCLASIEARSLANKEIVIVDGASEDSTHSVLNRYSSIVTHRLSEPDKGIYDALNKGCEMARGCYFYFMGSDDTLTEQFESIENLLIRPDTIYYGDVILAATGKRYDGAFSRFKLARTNISHQAIFYPREVFNSHRYSLKYPIQADWELNMKLWSESQFQFQYIDRLVALFAETGISSSQQDAAFDQDYLLLIKKYFPPRIYFYRKALSAFFTAAKSIVPGSIIDRINKLPFQI